MNDMTEARVLELIEAYGPEPSAWPQAERAAAEALLQSQPEAFESALEGARLLDAALAAMPEPQAPAGLAERIIASAPISPAPAQLGFMSKVKSWLSVGGSVIPSASALASAAVGMIVGYGTLGTVQVAEVNYADEAVYAAFDEGYDFNVGDFGG